MAKQVEKSDELEVTMVVYSWTVKQAEHQGIDAFELRERRGWLPAGACKPVLGRTE